LINVDANNNSDFVRDSTTASDGSEIPFEWRWEDRDGLVTINVRYANGQMDFKETGPGQPVDAIEALRIAREIASENYLIRSLDTD